MCQVLTELMSKATPPHARRQVFTVQHGIEKPLVSSDMRVLLLSMVLYLLGIVILLYLRPALMFHKDGRWKEFGLGNDDTTIFPLWMFCIGWAVISYGIGRISFREDSLELVKNVTAITSLATGKNLTDSLIEPLPLSGPESGELSKPGYYKLSTTIMRKKGVPRYIYVGTDAPAELDEV